MTGLSHLDSNFGSVFAIQAVNEPRMNPNDTPGYGDCKHPRFCLSPDLLVLLLTRRQHPVQKNFVQTMRVVESLLGVNTTVSPVVRLSPNQTLLSSNFTAAFTGMLIDSPHINPEVRQAVLASSPILIGLSQTMGFGRSTAGAPSLPPLRESLATKYVPSPPVVNGTTNFA